MLPVSASVWSVAPLLPYVQYPWRLLALFIPIVAIAAAYVSTKLSTKLLVILSVLSIMLVYGYKPALYERRDDAYYATRPNFTDGTSSMGNSFSTIWTPWKEERATAAAEVAVGEAVIEVQEEKPLRSVYTVNVKEVSDIQINTLYFPGWRAYKGKEVLPISYENDGLIHVSLPVGTHTLRVQFEETPIRKIADIVSILGLLWLGVWAILTCIYAYRHKYRSHVRRAQ
jgi:hypothetical protein